MRAPTKPKLKPCPCCGRKVEAYEEEEPGPGGPVPTGWEIYCECGLRMSDYSYAKLAKAWNRRDG